jgi:hypothetical protein
MKYPVSVVVPTIRGRRFLDEVVDAYRRQAEEVIVVSDRDCCGTAWADGYDAAAQRYVHFSADDLVPHDGALEAAVRALETGWYPCARIVNNDGSVHTCGSLGGGMPLPECPTGTVCNQCALPTFEATVLEDWVPKLRGLHYYGDDLMAFAARTESYDLRVVREFCFTHRMDVVGRGRVVARARQDFDRFVRRCVDYEGAVPDLAEHGELV